tara:strand:+ start:681 stop:1385 length:705 start_codon:yes stop_codon:yes gene_type:complete
MARLSGQKRAAKRTERRKSRTREQRKRWAKELSSLEEGKNYKLVDPGGFRKKRRVKSLKSKLNIPKKMPETTKSDGSKLASTTSGSKESQAKAQQKVIDSKEYKEGLKKLNKPKPFTNKASGNGGSKSKPTTPAVKKDSTPKKEKKSESKKDKPGSNVFTRHYKTGKTLGVMTRAQRRKYDAEAKAAGGKSYEERVAAHEKESGHGKPHKRETLYNISQRKKKKKDLKAIKKES